jgi:hypothetical protein
MCPHTAAILYMCPHTVLICGHEPGVAAVYVSSNCYICPHTTILYMCLHTATYVRILLYCICVLILSSYVGIKQESLEHRIGEATIEEVRTHVVV